jgi:hypothetical protein
MDGSMTKPTSTAEQWRDGNSYSLIRTYRDAHTSPRGARDWENDTEDAMFWQCVRKNGGAIWLANRDV